MMQFTKTRDLYNFTFYTAKLNILHQVKAILHK